MSDNEVKIWVRNPSEWPRAGSVFLSWQPVLEQVRRAGLSPDEIVLELKSDGETHLLPFQVDPIDPSDPSRAVLALRLEREVPHGVDDYSLDSAEVILRRGERERRSEGAHVDVADGGFHLSNDRLHIWFHTTPHKEGGDFFAGSASSVLRIDELLNRPTEMLDNFLADFPDMHDAEKRCMQVDRIRLSSPAGEPGNSHEEFLSRRPYELVSVSSGPVRASATVASEAFPYEYRDPTTREEIRLMCRLYRVLSLYPRADYVIEELHLKGTPQGRGVEAVAVDLYFSARYFAYMEMSFRPNIFHLETIPDWFSISSPFDPRQGYGFATDVHAAPVANPHPDFHDPDTARKTFSWDLGIGTQARCLHLFRRGRPEHLIDASGRAWYEHIYKPLMAFLPS